MVTWVVGAAFLGFGLQNSTHNIRLMLPHCLQLLSWVFLEGLEHISGSCRNVCVSGMDGTGRTGEWTGGKDGRLERAAGLHGGAADGGREASGEWGGGAFG